MVRNARTSKPNEILDYNQSLVCLSSKNKIGSRDRKSGPLFTPEWRKAL